MISHRLSNRLLRHHLPIAAAVFLCVWVLYVTRPSGDFLSRFSFATAYPALALVAATLLIGPMRVVRGRKLAVSIDLRRDFGIWAGSVGTAHALAGQFVHMHGRPWLYYVYEDWSQHVVPIRYDLFGVTNLTGLIATVVLVVLLAASNDFSLRRLGTPGWKQLQRWNYACFVMTTLHSFGYQILETQELPFVGTAAACVSITVILQLAGFVRRRRAPAASFNSLQGTNTQDSNR